MCTLTYHTELVELGRSLSAEQVPSQKPRVHLAHMRDFLEHLGCSETPQPASLRSLFLYVIESAEEADSNWAIRCIKQLKDTISFSEFFASFAEGLSAKQGEKDRRVTTKWWCLKEFGVDPPYL